MKVHKLSWLNVSVVVAVMFLLAACSLSNEGTTQQETEEPRQLSPTQMSGTAETVSTPISTGAPIRGSEVEVKVDKSIYQVGEQVEFTITNPLTRTIYYSYGGCGWPMPVYVRGSERFDLLVINVEGDPRVYELMPGESDMCTWDQQAFQELSKEIPYRFRSYFELAPVPPGHYQFRLNYGFNPDEVPPIFSDQAFTVYSQVFTVE